MKFYHLIQSNNWLSVKDTLLSIYPEQAKNIEGYEDAFQSLLVLTPCDMDMEITLDVQEDLLEEESFVTVGGKKTSEGKPGTTIYAIEFSPWSKWLGMDVTADTLKTYSELEIIAHCLFEMTFISFEEETIRHESKKLQDQIDEWENMSEEEKKKNSFTMEELMKKLNDSGK